MNKEKFRELIINNLEFIKGVSLKETNIQIEELKLQYINCWNGIEASFISNNIDSQIGVFNNLISNVKLLVYVKFNKSDSLVYITYQLSYDNNNVYYGNRNTDFFVYPTGELLVSKFVIKNDKLIELAN